MIYMSLIASKRSNVIFSFIEGFKTYQTFIHNYDVLE
jgi:hypothetical protein